MGTYWSNQNIFYFSYDLRNFPGWIGLQYFALLYLQMQTRAALSRVRPRQATRSTTCPMVTLEVTWAVAAPTTAMTWTSRAKYVAAAPPSPPTNCISWRGRLRRRNILMSSPGRSWPWDLISAKPECRFVMHKIFTFPIPMYAFDLKNPFTYFHNKITGTVKSSLKIWATKTTIFDKNSDDFLLLLLVIPNISSKDVSNNDFKNVKLHKIDFFNWSKLNLKICDILCLLNAQL